MARILSSLGVGIANFKPDRVPDDRQRSNQGLKRAGKKTLAWEAARRLLKIRFLASGITTCEAMFPHQCSRDWALSFAHSKKRNDIVGDEIYEVALLCPEAHRIADAGSKEHMHETILAIINAREVQP